MLLFIFAFGQGHGQQPFSRKIPLFPTAADSMAELRADSLKYSNPSKVLNSFLKAEIGLEGDDERRDYVTYSDLVWVKAMSKYSIPPEIGCDLNVDDYSIIKSFDIISTTRTNDSAAIGKVIFEQVALHFNDTVQIAENAYDTVTYLLVKSDGQWLVKDPPMQRILLNYALNWSDYARHPRLGNSNYLMVGKLPRNMTSKQLFVLWRYNLLVLDSIR